MSKPITIKLNKTADNAFERDLFYGVWGPFKAKIMKDDSLHISVLGGELQICAPQSNDYGQFYTVKFNEGLAFAAMKEFQGEQYLSLRLGKEVEIPEELKEKMSYKPKAKKTTATKKTTANTKKAASPW